MSNQDDTAPIAPESRGLVDIPYIPMPIEANLKREVIEDECKSAFKWAFVGAGQGGARLVEAFYKLGYRRVCCVNTTAQDMASVAIPQENKLVMDMGEGGAGKNPEKGAVAVQQYKEDVYDLMRRSFGKDFDRIMVCVGAGGGTGGGACEALIDIAHDIAESFRLEGQPGEPPVVGALAALPMVSEGQAVNANAHRLAEMLLSKVGSDKGKMGGRTLSPLIIVDNERIKTIYPGLSSSAFWQTANQSIASLFYLFNNIATAEGDIWTFDKADLRGIWDSGTITFGACPLQKWNDATDISFAIRDNVKRTILVGGLDVKTSSIAACVFIAAPEILDTVPQEHFEHGFEMLARCMSAEQNIVHRGLYRGNQKGLVVYSILGELGRPESRMEELARVGKVQMKGLRR